MIPREIALASKFEIKRKSYATTQYLRTVKILPPLQEVSYKKFVSKKKNCIQTNKVLLYMQGTLLSVMWQHGWEANLGENGYMCMYG